MKYYTVINPSDLDSVAVWAADPNRSVRIITSRSPSGDRAWLAVGGSHSDHPYVEQFLAAWGDLVEELVLERL
jgi:hypothetical protein